MKNELSLPSNVSLYIGSPIQHYSECEILKVLCEELRTYGQCFVFANFHLLSRQIDFLVAADQRLHLIEAKSSSRPINGGFNGDWVTVGPAARTKTIRNGYEQTLSAKNLVRDFIQGIEPSATAYPNAMACYVPRIPEGSNLTKGDFKVRVGSLNELPSTLKNSGQAVWGSGLWEKFVAELGLVKVADINAAVSDELYHSHALRESYSDSFIRFYKPTADELVSDQYVIDDVSETLARIEQLVLEEKADIVITGPSGCGKSLLARSLAVKSIPANFVPVILGAKHFNGSLKELFKREVLQLNISNATTFWRSLRKLHAPILLVIDGLNECPESRRSDLLRQVDAIASNNIAQIAVTTQVSLERNDYFALTAIKISNPSLSLKARIANVDPSNPLNGNLLKLLQSVSSGLEASLVGSVGQMMPPSSSRASLFDAYIRSRVGEEAAYAIKLLCILSDRLIDRASFSLTNVEYEREAINEDIPLHILESIAKSKLLEFRMGRVSFIHEMFYAYFGAEALARKANGRPEQLALTLMHPKFSAFKSMLLSGLHEELIETLLTLTNDSDLLIDCLEGACGEAAKTIAARMLESYLGKMAREAKQVSFSLTEDNQVRIDAASLITSYAERSAFTRVLVDEIFKDRKIEVVLSALRLMDENFNETFKKLLPVGKERNISIRSLLFSTAYVRGDTALCHLVATTHSGAWFNKKPSVGMLRTIHDAWLKASTFGEYYFLLNFIRMSEDPLVFAPKVLEILKNINRYPYHLRLDVFHFAMYFRDIAEPLRTDFVDGLTAALSESNPFLNSSVFEALSAFGALSDDNEKYKESVMREIEEVLVGLPSPERDGRAWAVYSSQFDHPYDGAYWETIESLNAEQKKELYIRAAHGVPDSSYFFASTLMQRLSDYKGEDVVDALKRWTALPIPPCGLPQEAAETLIEAYVALAKVGASLPHIQADEHSLTELAIISCAELFYISELAGTEDWHRKELHRIEAILLAPEQRAAAAALQICSQRWSLSKKSLTQLYPELSLEICRNALNHIDQQVNYFLPGFMGEPHSIATFALNVIGGKGNAGDLVQLRRLANEPRLSSPALSAIKEIEERVNFAG